MWRGAPQRYTPRERMDVEADDAQIARRIATGRVDGEAEALFCARYTPKIRAFANRRTRDRQSALDLTQDALLAVLEAMRAGRIEDPARLGAFVLGTCRRIASHGARTARRR